MALTTVSNGNTAQASDLNQVINTLQQPAAAQEKGKYYLESGAYANVVFMSTYYRTTSQGSTPVSVTIDTADQAPAGCNSPLTAQLTSFGFQVKANSTGITTDARCGGNYTVQY